MIAVRRLMDAHRRALLIFVLAAVGMSALVPAGTMIAPAGTQGASIILCPQTHPLARALGAQAAPDMAALHAAMGHGGHHAGMDHPAMDHAAMGHAPAVAGDPAPNPDPAPDPASTANPQQSCAFASLALAAVLAGRSTALSAPLALLPEPLAFPERLQLVAPAHLRPPLRAPPALI